MCKLIVNIGYIFGRIMPAFLAASGYLAISGYFMDYLLRISSLLCLVQSFEIYLQGVSL